MLNLMVWELRADTMHRLALWLTVQNVAHEQDKHYKVRKQEKTAVWPLCFHFHLVAEPCGSSSPPWFRCFAPKQIRGSPLRAPHLSPLWGCRPSSVQAVQPAVQTSWSLRPAVQQEMRVFGTQWPKRMPWPAFRMPPCSCVSASSPRECD